MAKEEVIVQESQSVHKVRTILGFLLSPLVVAIVAFIGNGIIQRVYTHPVLSAQAMVASFLYCCIFSLPVAYIAELLLGLPTWLILRSYCITSLYVYCICGALIGLTAAHVLALLGYGSWVDWAEYLLHPPRWMNLPTFSAVAGGAVAAVLFRITSVSSGLNRRSSHRADAPVAAGF